MEKIEILEDKIWKETGWASFNAMKEYSGDTQRKWSDNEYNYAAVKFSVDETLEVYRQKIKKCKCKSCYRPEKVILLYAGSVAQANEYIKSNIKIIVSDHQLRGYNKDRAILIALAAEARRIKIIEA